MRRKQRFLSVLLALCLCFGMLPVSAMAIEPNAVTTWDALKTAVESANSDAIIHISGTLTKDAEDAVITLPANVHITLVGDLTEDAAAKIVRPNKSAVGEFVVSSGAALTLQGAITVAGAETSGKPGDLAFANFIQVQEGGALNIEGAVTASTSGAVNSTGQYGLISCAGTATIKDGAALSGWVSSQSSGTFDDERAALVVKGQNASLTMTGGEVFGNQNSASSGTVSSSAIQIRDGASFKMENGSIHNNLVGKNTTGVKGCGGGVLVAGGGCKFEMTGGSIANNSGRYGAGVYIEGTNTNAVFTMTGGSISENILNQSGGSYGGGLYAQDTTVTITKPEGAKEAPVFSGNKTSIFPGEMWSPFTGDGGAIYCSNVTLTMDGAIVKDTKAESTNYHGGTIHLVDTKAELKNSEVKDNQCGNVNMAFAGAFYIEGASDITMDHMTITGNSAVPNSNYGNGGVGGILIFGESNAFAKLTISNSDISGNFTGGSESGAIHTECTELTITDTTINNNSVAYNETNDNNIGYGYYAGAMYLAGSTVNMERVTLEGNKCVDGLGGAIMMEDITDRSGSVTAPCNVTLTDCILNGNQAPQVNTDLDGGLGGAIYVGSGTLTVKGKSEITYNSAFAGGGILVAPDGVVHLQDDTVVSGNTSAAGGNGDGVCVMSNATPDSAATKAGTFAVQDSVRIDANNDVTLFPSAVITISNDYTGADGAHPVHITSYEEDIETIANGDVTSSGTPLVLYTEPAGDADSAAAADVGKFFVPSKYMPNPDGPNAGKLLMIGQSEEADKTQYLTYIGAAQAVNVTFDANGGSYADADTTKTYRVPAAGNLALPENPMNGDQVFNGWNTAADGTGTAYAPGVAIPAPDADTTYYAQWKSGGNTGGGGGSVTTKYTLTYESNGGTEYQDERYARNTTVKLDKVPAREGYQFTGWYADEDLTQKISEVKMTSDKTVYAGWQASAVPDMLNGKDHFAYVVGYPDGSVGPKDNITRAETATIFFRLLKDEVRDENLTYTSGFEDVESGAWYSTPVCTMAELGIVKGRTETTFAPTAPITRAEFAAICARFDTGLTNGDSNFTDIDGHWAKDEIERAATLGWVQGDPDGRFRPNAYITRAEAMTMINRVLCRIPETESDLLNGMNVWPDNQPGAWYYLAVQEATNSHDFERKGEVFEKWTVLTEDPDWTRYEQ